MRMICGTVLALCAAAEGQVRAPVEKYVAAHQGQIVRELAELLAIPNIAADRGGIRRNTEYLAPMLERRGFRAEILETAGNPLVYGERKTPGAARTILYYIHYDGQPVDRPKWKQADPFQPILRDGRMEDGGREIADFLKLGRFQDDWRIYARSASDDKAPIVAFCAALDALAAAGRAPGANLRVILDGEEEAGSPSISAAIGRYREKLAADLLIILDGPTHANGEPTLSFGARGEVALDLTVYGPKFNLHSGHYGNWAPNPAIRLAQLLGSMKDEQGRVTIAGFYDGIPPLTAEERRILRSVPDDLPALKRLFGIESTDAVGETLQEAIQYPSLNVRGLRSGYVGAEARTIIPTDATAAIDIRLVKETPSAAMVQKVMAHIRKQGFHVVESEPDDATRMRYGKIARVAATEEPTEAFRTEMDSPDGVALTRALEAAWGKGPVRIRTMGGTVPISQFIRELKCPAIGLPMVNFDNNQHSENENLRLGHLWKGIVSIAAALEIK
jgi:acetylornithine deacetylase/succinyl-diaminopimelate desuccinylase-like protein